MVLSLTDSKLKALIKYQGNLLTLNLTDSKLAELVLDAQASGVNLLSREFQDELDAALTRLESASGVTGLLISSAKDSFMLGADIGQFMDIFARGATAVTAYLGITHGLFCRLEALPFPTLAAINGVALGGGLELALAADFRIAEPGTRLGLPEVNLGLCPGWGGTVRLSRLIGPAATLDWILSGRQQGAEQARKQGVVDALATRETLLDEGRAWLNRAASGELNFRQCRDRKRAALPDNAETAATIQALHDQHAATAADANYPAKGGILQTLTDNMTADYSDALQAEAQLFGKLASGDTAKNLIGVFQGGQLIKKRARAWAKKATLVRRAAVLGAGTMGGGIAYQSAHSQIPILMKDVAQNALDLGMQTATGLLDRLIAKRKLAPEQKNAVLDRITPTLDYQEFSEVDCAIEAVTENIDIKAAVLAELETAVNADTVIASNTSTISIDALAKNLNHPQRFCGMHFFNPVHAMPLVEVVRGQHTAEATLARTVAYALALGKTPIVVRDCPGFLVNRVLFPYFNGFNRLLRDGVDFQRIDRLMETFGWPMGPAYLADVVGLDVMAHADAVMQQGFPERMTHSTRPFIEQLLAGGALGQKSGAGFYQYGKDARGVRNKIASPAALEMLEKYADKNAGMKIADQKIVDRLMIPMCLEAVRCLEEGVVAAPAEVDMSLILGLGFPRFRGGALRYIESLGLAEFARRAENCTAHGPLYHLTAGFKQKLESGHAFYE
ncbi:MAG: fatty acid oxidation complex subunit alpha FadB [Cellvibrionales bacterium]|nr:fatty acid oxidation complex subunit alpha FadB [Cellvibrionales bacterium]